MAAASAPSVRRVTVVLEDAGDVGRISAVVPAGSPIVTVRPNGALSAVAPDAGRWAATMSGLPDLARDAPHDVLILSSPAVTLTAATLGALQHTLALDSACATVSVVDGIGDPRDGLPGPVNDSPQRRVHVRAQPPI